MRKPKPMASTVALTRGTPGSAGLDLAVGMVGRMFAFDEARPALLGSNPTRIPTGVRVAIPTGHMGLILPRSSLAMEGLVVESPPIDSDYRGELSIIARTAPGMQPVRLWPGRRIAQLVVIPCWMGEVSVVETLDETWRGDGGFGSTGV